MLGFRKMKKSVVLIESIIITVICGASWSVFGGVCAISTQNHPYLYLFFSVLAMFFSFFLLPSLIISTLKKKHSGFNICRIKSKSVVEIIVFILVSLLWADWHAVIFYFGIGIFEEILFRHILWEHLRSEFDMKGTLIINAIIFSFLFHINSSFISNCIIRFPIGILFGLISNRYGLSKSIIAHSLYDISLTLSF